MALPECPLCDARLLERSARLVRVLPDYGIRSTEAFLADPSVRYMRPVIRAFTDFAIARLRAVGGVSATARARGIVASRSQAPGSEPELVTSPSPTSPSWTISVEVSRESHPRSSGCCASAATDDDHAALRFLRPKPATSPQRVPRLAWRIDWLTPLAADPNVAPRTRALQEVLPLPSALGEQGRLRLRSTTVRPVFGDAVLATTSSS